MDVVRVATYADGTMDVKGAKVLRERLQEADEERRFIPRRVTPDADAAGEEQRPELPSADDSAE